MQSNKIKESTLVVRKHNAQIYKENLTALKQHYPTMYDAVVTAKPKNIRIDPGITIQGLNNPLIMLLIGFSTRSIYDNLLRNKKRIENVFIIEPNLNTFNNLLRCENVVNLLANPKLDFILGVQDKEALKGQLFQVLSKADQGTPVLRTTRMKSVEGMFDLFQYPTAKDQKKVAWMNEALDEIRKVIELSMGCGDDTFFRWELLMQNSKYMHKAYSVKPLFGCFEGIPIIVCGGGPSLQDFLDAYKKNPKLANALLIASDAVLKKLADAGVRIDMVVRCERKETSIFKGVTKEMTKGIYYCAYPWTPTNFMEMFDKPKTEEGGLVYLMRNNGTCSYTPYLDVGEPPKVPGGKVKVPNWPLQHGAVNGGVSSGNACAELAFLLSGGNKKKANIIFAGIDLAFGPKGASHVGGTQVEFNLEKSKKLWTKQKNNIGRLSTTIPVWVRCWNEYQGAVLKHRDGEKRNFEIYNTSTHGLVIAGTKYMPWKKLVAQSFWNHKQDVRKILKSNLKTHPDKMWKAFLKKNENTALILTEQYDDLKTALNVCTDNVKTAEREIEKLTKRMVSEYHGYELVKAVKANQKNYDKLWESAAEPLDMFYKQKYWYELYFRMTIFDTLQLDGYHYDNFFGSLPNIFEKNDERYYEYIKQTKDFYIKADYYYEKFIELFEKYSHDSEKKAACGKRKA